MGACIALTAFPMLARIINERGLADTALGTLSLTAGAFDDAVSWCVLAIVLATFGGGPGVALIAIVGGLGFALFMFFIGRRMLLPLGRIVEERDELRDRKSTRLNSSQSCASRMPSSACKTNRQIESDHINTTRTKTHT